MIGGFTFDGVDIDSLHLEYAPDNSNTYVYKPTQGVIHDETVEGHDGGYFYGVTLQPKTFVLRCIYQDEEINYGILTRIYTVFKQGRSGKLVFQKRPWCWYSATVVSVDTSQMLNHMNGIVTITMKAYYPFARSDFWYIDNTDDNFKVILDNSAYMVGSAWEYSDEMISQGDTLDSTTTFSIINAGTAPAKLSISIAGDVGSGVYVYNKTTKQEMMFVGITKANTTNVGKYIVTDCLNAKTLITNGTISNPGYLYHNYGFIDLAPAYPIVRDIKISSTQNGSVIHSDHAFTPNMVDKYIYTNNNGFHSKIVSYVDDSTIYVNSSTPTLDNESASVFDVNEIVVSPVDTMELTKLKFSFKPTFA